LAAGQISGTPLTGSLPASGATEEGAKNFVLRAASLATTRPAPDFGLPGTNAAAAFGSRIRRK